MYGTIVKTTISTLLALCLSLAMTAGVIAGDGNAAAVAKIERLTVYKSPTCGCCKVWIKHVNQAGFKTATEQPANLNDVKSELGVPPQVRSCHTAVSESGYVFEGHIPAKLIKRFLADPPDDALGLTVPGMPVGSPGMESGNRFMPYDVLLINKDGSTAVYASMKTAAEQY